MARVLVSMTALLAALSLTGAVSAQDEDPFDRAARETELGPLGPIAVLTIHGVRAGPADSFSFYVYWDPPSPSTAPGRERRYAIRKASRTSTDVSWATSRDCPAVVEVMTAMEAIPSPRIDMPGLGADPSTINMVLDGAGYHLSVRWALFPDDSQAYTLRMSGNVNTPLAAWAATLDPALADCWTTEPPLPVRPPR